MDLKRLSRNKQHSFIVAEIMLMMIMTLPLPWYLHPACVYKLEARWRYAFFHHRIENVPVCVPVCLHGVCVVRTYHTHIYFAMKTSMHYMFVLCVAAVMADGVLVGLGSTLSPGLSVAKSSICDNVA